MSNLIDDTRGVLRRSRAVADNADFLSFALLSGDRGKIEDAVTDLVAAYDSYTGQAESFSKLLGFDAVAESADAGERDQKTADSLASALVDLEVASVMGLAAQATGELEGEAASAELDGAVATLNETLKAIEGGSETAPGITYFAFDEVTAAQPANLSSSDVATAKATYEQQVKTFYETLLTETTALLAAAFKAFSGLDAEQLSQGLKAVVGPIEVLPGSGLAARALEALKRAIETLKGILGPKLHDEIEEKINKRIEEIREGGGVLQMFLKYSYDYDDGQKEIVGFLQTSQSDFTTIDAGAQTLRQLQLQMAQTFALEKRIITTLRTLSHPIKWMLNRFGGTLPLDLIMCGAYVLVVDVALVRGMDYADTTKIISWVDGVRVISKRTLGVK
jgi:hypothetical protein